MRRQLLSFYRQDKLKALEEVITAGHDPFSTVVRLSHHHFVFDETDMMNYLCTHLTRFDCTLEEAE